MTGTATAGCRIGSVSVKVPAGCPPIVVFCAGASGSLAVNAISEASLSS